MSSNDYNSSFSCSLQVNILKFENNRLREEMSKLKKDYFSQRKEQDRLADSQNNPLGDFNYAASLPGQQQPAEQVNKLIN